SDAQGGTVALLCRPGGEPRFHVAPPFAARTAPSLFKHRSTDALSDGHADSAARGQRHRLGALPPRARLPHRTPARLSGLHANLARIFPRSGKEPGARFRSEHRNHVRGAAARDRPDLRRQIAPRHERLARSKIVRWISAFGSTCQSPHGCGCAHQTEEEKRAMKIDVVKSGAPRPLANYSEAMVAGPWIFAAGQLASDFKTGVPAVARKHPNFPFYGSDIKLQTRFVLENLKKTFEAAGSSLDNVFKAQVFLTNLNDFFAFDEVWKEYFKLPPARTTVGTSGLLVKDTLVEIDLIGFVPGKGVDKQVIKSNAPRPLAHYNEAFKIGDFVYAAGQIASDYKTGIPADAIRSPNFPFYSSDIKLQTRYILENLKKT